MQICFCFFITVLQSQQTLFVLKAKVKKSDLNSVRTTLGIPKLQHNPIFVIKTFKVSFTPKSVFIYLQTCNSIHVFLSNPRHV